MPFPTLAPILAASRLSGVPLSWMPAHEIHQPYRKLLVHDHDMTSELAAFHRDSISLKVLQSRLAEPTYHREVTLHAATSGTTVEYGLIEILLGSFPPGIRTRILSGETPLGTILTTSRLPFRSEPQGFFSVPGQALGDLFPPSASGKILFGRYNHLIGNQSATFARIIEILPSQDPHVPV